MFLEGNFVGKDWVLFFALIGEPSAVDTASCLMTQRDQPDEVAAVRLRPVAHHLAPA